MGFSQALSGVNAASQQLDVIGNNISNSQTKGFKSGSVQFSDVFANSAVGLGTRVSGILQDFSSGSLEATGRNLDIAIAGDGFLRFQQEGQVGYSRNGQLTMTADGYLENAQGARLMGYGLADATDVNSGVVTGGQPGVLNIPAADMPASATGATGTGINILLNLDGATVADDTSTATLYNDLTAKNGEDTTNQTSIAYNYSTSFTVYDSQGAQHNATLYFQKTGENTWVARTALDGVLTADSLGSVADPATAEAPLRLTFDNSGKLATINGEATTANPVTWPDLTFTANELGTGVEEINATFNMAGSTQFAGDSTVKSLAQDGYAAGALVGISFADDGTIVGNYSNEKTVDLGQIALATFRNPEGLTPSGDNLFAATAASGNELLGIAGTGTLGSIESETLEASNVDLTQELVNLIIAQRNYQANTNSIRTQSEVMDQIAQLR
ncbi:flagellar hook protein FlgE [Salinicola sp. MIT1003]|uniref:flagellar hook protein FlgE n=1 Tax=Salinicola sp. MIT1003 TaxID=1882734 RepID=UPI0008DCF578|nr:flagellar hook protein FlgE [Salinicola sp. MIT1003]OHZ02628.1 flagellar hook protein FlgE [Salinicola sp. MIT1003]